MEQSIVHLFVFETMSDWETGYAVGFINNPQFQKQPGRYVVRTVGYTLDSIRTMGGMTILPDMKLEDVKPSKSSMLILPGGISWDSNPDLLTGASEKAKEFLASNVPIAAICGATAGMARAGILDNRYHTSNSPVYLAMTDYKGAEYYRNDLAVLDDNVITASVVGALEFAYQIFKKLDLFTDEVLESWYKLFKTGDPTYFEKMQNRK